MSTELEKVYQLLFSSGENIELANQLLKKRPDLRKLAEQEFASSLSILGKKQFRSIISLLKKYSEREKLNKNEKLALIAHPKLAERITKLSLADYRLEDLPNQINQLKNVEELDLRINKLNSLPSGISELDQLKKLYLSNNHFTEFPDIIQANIKLKELLLDTNKISKVSDSITKLQELQFLSLARNKLKAFPEAIAHLGRLEQLIMIDNNLDQFPKQLSNMSNLKFMNLWGWKNKFKYLPEDLGELPNLECIFLSSVAAIENISVITECTNLKELNLGLTHTTLPKTINKLQTLDRLSLYGNKHYHIQDLPKEIKELQNLKHLDIWEHNIDKATQKEITEALPNCHVSFT